MRFKLALLFVGVIALVAMLAPGGGVAATKGGCAISGKANSRARILTAASDPMSGAVSAFALARP